MTQNNKSFLTNGCYPYVLSPELVEVRCYHNSEFTIHGTVESHKGKPGRFKVQTTNPLHFVHQKKCTGSSNGANGSLTIVSLEVNGNLSSKVIYRRYRQVNYIVFLIS